MTALPPSLRRWCRQFGVTRLARLTGLDRCGVEVVGAVRPGGHVLQVSQGKGLTLEAAQWSALSEAIELSAAEQPDLSTLRFGPAPEGAAWDVHGLSVAWAPATGLPGGAPSWVPAERVYCPPSGTCWLGPSLAPWLSNGLGAHPTSRAHAVEHAVLELLERDALARVLPHGWTPHVTLSRLVEAPAAVKPLRERGFGCFLFDLAPPGLSLHVAGALLFDLEGGPVPLTAGYACRRSWAAAAEAAWLEAAQSRLTEIHGAREDVLFGEREDGSALLRLLEGVTPRPAPRGVERRALSRLVRARVELVELRREPFVVKAVSPDLLTSELL